VKQQVRQRRWPATQWSSKC